MELNLSIVRWKREPWCRKCGNSSRKVIPWKNPFRIELSKKKTTKPGKDRYVVFGQKLIHHALKFSGKGHLVKSLTFFRTHKKKQPHFIGEGGGLVVKSFGSQPTSHISYPRENFGENHQLKKKKVVLPWEIGLVFVGRASFLRKLYWFSG